MEPERNLEDLAQITIPISQSDVIIHAELDYPYLCEQYTSRISDPCSEELWAEKAEQYRALNPSSQTPPELFYFNFPEQGAEELYDSGNAAGDAATFADDSDPVGKLEF